MHELTRPPSIELDEFEYRIACYALDADIPLLGICRGHQMMNVARGGTLFQDMRDQLGVNHKPMHHIKWRRRSEFVDMLPQHCGAEVNSIHHQAVDEVGDGFKIAAYCFDYVVEAIEMPRARFALGVQFHPERMRTRLASSIFKRFVSAAADYNKSRQFEDNVNYFIDEVLPIRYDGDFFTATSI